MSGDEELAGGRAFRRRFEANGAIDFGYATIAEYLTLSDAEGKPWASFFATTYIADGKASTPRPVAFIFNGGPGSCAQWLQMGALGPRRLCLADPPDTPGAPPHAVIDHGETLLRVADLVFIDPVGTGYSHALGSYQDPDFWGVREDARSIAAAIEAWLSRHRRWSMPKFLISESYGTIRASVLADRLAERHIALDGIALIAPVLDYRHSRPRAGDGGVLAYLSFFPTYAAAAHYHGRARNADSVCDRVRFVEAAKQFTMTDLARALVANSSRMAPADYAAIVERYAGFTGLAPAEIERAGLRIGPDRFAAMLLGDEGKRIGRLDARFVAAADPVGDPAGEHDPAFDAVASLFTAAMHDELDRLGVVSERAFQAMVPLYKNWDWRLDPAAPSGGGFLDVVPLLVRAMARTPQLRLFLAPGYHDLATPFFGAENALSRVGVAQDRLTWSHHDSGHMIFLDSACRTQLLADLRTFVASARPSGGST